MRQLVHTKIGFVDQYQEIHIIIVGNIGLVNNPCHFSVFVDDAIYYADFCGFVYDDGYLTAYAHFPRIDHESDSVAMPLLLVYDDSMQLVLSRA